MSYNKAFTLHYLTLYYILQGLLVVLLIVFIMSACQLTEQTRERVVSSSLNHSSSKHMWTFPKKKRFAKMKPQCPHASYQSQISTFNPHYPKFSNTSRAIFEDKEHFPSPADYNPNLLKTSKNLQTFGQSRSKCALGSYLRGEQLRNPAPTDYQKFTADDTHRSRKGFSLRPRTANSYNCKQQLTHILSTIKKNSRFPVLSRGRFKIAKFKSTNMTGGTGLMCRSQRFLTTEHSPGPSTYEPKKVALRNSFHCPMNKTMRSSWIDRINTKETSPGPGDYQLPSQFGHYVKPKSRRMMTIQ